MAIIEVEPTSRSERAVMYDGTNATEIREFLSMQAEPRLAVLGATCPFIRRDALPDHPLLPGDAILMDQDGWAHHVSAAAMARCYIKRNT